MGHFCVRIACVVLAAFAASASAPADELGAPMDVEFKAKVDGSVRCREPGARR